MKQYEISTATQQLAYNLSYLDGRYSKEDVAILRICDERLIYGAVVGRDYFNLVAKRVREWTKSLNSCKPQERIFDFNFWKSNGTMTNMAHAAVIPSNIGNPEIRNVPTLLE